MCLTQYGCIGKKEGNRMLTFGIVMSLCAAILYCCVAVGERSDEKYQRLWEEYLAGHQKEKEEEKKWEDQES